MKRESSKKIVTIEEHSLILDQADLMHALEADDPSRVIDNPELKAILYVGQEAVAPSALINMIRAMNPDIPEHAKLTLAVTWQEQVEIDPAQMQPMPPPQYAPPPQYYQQQPPPYTGHPPAGYQPPMQPPVAQPTPQAHGQQCRTCGAVPMVHGPTPDCMDAGGCGRVLRERGQLLPPKTVPPPGAPDVGIGTGAPAPGILINRETGETAFADKNGMPYGRHDDYSAR
jgi:hypothetical protein